MRAVEHLLIKDLLYNNYDFTQKVVVHCNEIGLKISEISSGARKQILPEPAAEPESSNYIYINEKLKALLKFADYILSVPCFTFSSELK